MKNREAGGKCERRTNENSIKQSIDILCIVFNNRCLPIFTFFIVLYNTLPVQIAMYCRLLLCFLCLRLSPFELRSMLTRLHAHIQDNWKELLHATNIPVWFQYKATNLLTQCKQLLNQFYVCKLFENVASCWKRVHRLSLSQHLAICGKYLC